MINLPIVQRELLVASRGLGSWLWRWILAIVAVSFGGLWLLLASINQGGGPGMQGDIFFAILSWASFGYCLLCGLWTTTDTLTREKSEGTLGLLFLTDLRGYDVVLGKMFTGSLRSFYGVLAVMPVLALPLLMGGVTNAQFWRTIGALLNILIFSLSSGIFFSAFCYRMGKSILWTLILLVSITFIPLTYVWTGGTDPALSLVSPGYAMYRAVSPLIGPATPGWGWYPLWIGCGLSSSVLLLALASIVIPHRWQDRQVRPTTLAGQVDEVNAVSTVKNRRTVHLGSNPVSWLVNRNASTRISRGLLIGFIIVAWLVVVILSVSRLRFWDQEVLITIGLVALWLASLWFRIDLTRHTVASLSEAKECGALEQILVTPLGEKQFRWGHFRAMARFWLWPFAMLFAAPVSYFALQVLQHPEVLEPSLAMIGGIFLIIMIVVPLLGVILDIFALYFTGCWFALRNQSFGTAFWKTFGFVYLLPTVGSLFLCGIGSFVSLITGIIFIVWPLTSLQSNFRRVVSGEYGQPYTQKIKREAVPTIKPPPRITPG